MFGVHPHIKCYQNLKQSVTQYKRKHRLALSLHIVVCVHHALAQNMTITGASHFSLLFLRIPLQIIFLVDVKS